MSKRRKKEDPTYLRIEYYWLKTRLVEIKSESGPNQKNAEPELSLGAKVEEVVDSVVAELTTGEEQVREEKTLLGLTRATEETLIRTIDLLRSLRWPYAGRRGPWWRRLLWWSPSAWQARLPLRRRYRGLPDFLDGMLEPATVVLYCSCLVEGEGLEKAGVTIKPDRPEAAYDLIKRREASKREQVDGEDKAKLRSDWIAAYVEYLRSPPRKKRFWIKRGVGWLGLSYNWRRLRKPHYRVRYNLACLFSRLAAEADDKDDADRYVEESATQLRLCVESLRGPERQAIAAWARRDPGLAHLKSKGKLERVIPNPTAG